MQRIKQTWEEKEEETKLDEEKKIPKEKTPTNQDTQDNQKQIQPNHDHYQVDQCKHKEDASDKDEEADCHI